MVAPFNLCILIDNRDVIDTTNTERMVFYKFWERKAKSISKEKGEKMDNNQNILTRIMPLTIYYSLCNA